MEKSGNSGPSSSLEGKTKAIGNAPMAALLRKGREENKKNRMGDVNGGER